MFCHLRSYCLNSYQFLPVCPHPLGRVGFIHAFPTLTLSSHSLSIYIYTYIYAMNILHNRDCMYNIVVVETIHNI